LEEVKEEILAQEQQKVEVELNGKIYSIPLSINDLVLSQWIKIRQIQLNENLTEAEIEVLFYEVILGIPKDELLKVRYSDINRLRPFIMNLFNGELKKKLDAQTIKINNQYYAFDSDLDNRLTFGSFIDAFQYSKNERTISELMAVLIREVTDDFEPDKFYRRVKVKPYKLDSFEQRVELFSKHLPMAYANPVLVFFCLLDKG
jgi:hypothetical protein